MLLLMAMLVQDIPGPPGDDAVAIPRLAAPAGARDCPPTDGEEILVCGRQEEFRLRTLPEPGGRGPLRVRLSPNKTATVRTEQSGNPFLQTPRLMLDFGLVF